MKKYKVFYKKNDLEEIEVAEFNIMYNAIVYIHNQLGIDKDLKKENFYIYELQIITIEQEYNKNIL